MAQNGKPLTKIDSPGRSMLYSLGNGQTARVRTCNDHILVILADRATNDAKLNIDGTDFLLIVMPEVERTHGNVIAYLVPTNVAIDAARKTHREWLSTKPNTKGDNKTWNLWFDPDGPEKANDFALKWNSYRLRGLATTEGGQQPNESGLRGEVEAARQRIAAAAGVSPAAVRITVDFGV
jgi:hypothetical protein